MEAAAWRLLSEPDLLRLVQGHRCDEAEVVGQPGGPTTGEVESHHRENGAGRKHFIFDDSVGAQPPQHRTQAASKVLCFVRMLSGASKQRAAADIIMVKIMRRSLASPFWTCS